MHWQRRDRLLQRICPLDNFLAVQVSCFRVELHLDRVADRGFGDLGKYGPEYQQHEQKRKACQATVSRKLEDGSRFFPDQRMSRMEALKSYTINCAYAAFEEDIKGTLSPGKLADIVVLSKDILTCPEEEILDAQVIYTIVGGEVRHHNDDTGVAAR